MHVTLALLGCDGRAWKVHGRAQALVGSGLATPLQKHFLILLKKLHFSFYIHHLFNVWHIHRWRNQGALGALAPTKFTNAHRNLAFHNRNVSC